MNNNIISIWMFAVITEKISINWWTGVMKLCLTFRRLQFTQTFRVSYTSLSDALTPYYNDVLLLLGKCSKMSSHGKPSSSFSFSRSLFSYKENHILADPLVVRSYIGNCSEYLALLLRETFLEMLPLCHVPLGSGKSFWEKVRHYTTSEKTVTNFKGTTRDSLHYLGRILSTYL